MELDNPDDDHDNYAHCQSGEEVCGVPSNFVYRLVLLTGICIHTGWGAEDIGMAALPWLSLNFIVTYAKVRKSGSTFPLT